jgi:hypothetical protein
VGSTEDLFLRLLQELDKGGVLQQIVLIGSWALPIYRRFFDDDPEIPILRTTDVDFLVGNPPKITSPMDIQRSLSELGFEPAWAVSGGYCKYVHPDMEVEFLIPEKGAGVSHAIEIEDLNVTAQPLRYLSIAYDYSMPVEYHGLRVRVPEPEAFVLLKLLVLPRRKDAAKSEKDIVTASVLGSYLLKRPDRSVLLKLLFDELPKTAS